MKRFITRIKAKVQLVLFLLWHDKEPRGATKWIILSFLSLVGTLWGFPLENMTETKMMLPQTQYSIRLAGTGLLIILGLTCLTTLLRFRNRKYMNPPNLTDEELNIFLKYTNEAK